MAKGIFTESFIRFERGNKVYNHHGIYLGHLWYNDKFKVHKQWCWVPATGIFMTKNCLDEISAKLDEMNKNEEKEKT